METYPKYRISVTQLEKFRRYMNDESSFDTEESLIESLKGLFIGNDKTKFGGAYHKIIEGDYQLQKNGSVMVVSDNLNFFFTPQQALPAICFKKLHPLMVHEMNVSKVYETSYFPIQVSGRVDGIEGCQVRDTKTKFRAVDITEYMDSFQWRYYLDMLGLDVFWYDLFEVRGFKELPASSVIVPEGQIIYHEPLKCERYETMQLDLTALLNDFLDYIFNRNFIHLLKPAIEQEEPSFV